MIPRPPQDNSGLGKMSSPMLSLTKKWATTRGPNYQTGFVHPVVTRKFRNSPKLPVEIPGGLPIKQTTGWEVGAPQVQTDVQHLWELLSAEDEALGRMLTSASPDSSEGPFTPLSIEGEEAYAENLRQLQSSDPGMTPELSPDGEWFAMQQQTGLDRAETELGALHTQDQTTSYASQQMGVSSQLSGPELGGWNDAPGSFYSGAAETEGTHGYWSQELPYDSLATQPYEALLHGPPDFAYYDEQVRSDQLAMGDGGLPVHGSASAL